MNKEQPLPKIVTISELHYALFQMKLTRHSMDGYVVGLDRSRPNDNLLSHIYFGEYSELKKGMCAKAYNKNGGFSIFRNNIARDICRNCLKNTLKELLTDK